MVTPHIINPRLQQVAGRVFHQPDIVISCFTIRWLRQSDVLYQLISFGSGLQYCEGQEAELGEHLAAKQ